MSASPSHAPGATVRTVRPDGTETLSAADLTFVEEAAGAPPGPATMTQSAGESTMSLGLAELEPLEASPIQVTPLPGELRAPTAEELAAVRPSPRPMPSREPTARMWGRPSPYVSVPRVAASRRSGFIPGGSLPHLASSLRGQVERMLAHRHTQQVLAELTHVLTAVVDGIADVVIAVRRQTRGLGR